ncbi:hypothetical protein [Paraflavitalea speifideaquila]|uniref:hypothetical protein n=1 Tax=Paraflavitalea speifideaquila TaxID=3076558 RepID=UPI0028E7A5F0|nr:hypothetical protein [Paraflavitalea speifideiaquila]
MEYFKKLQELLKIEQEEDKKLYQQQATTLSVIERRSYGLTWYPIAIRDTEMTRGDYLSVEVERTTHQDIVHQLRFGAAAALFSNHNAKDDRVEGVVTWQGGNKLKITLRTDELPDWARDGKLGIDLLFDDNSYEEMQNALKQAIVHSEKKRRGPFNTNTYRCPIPRLSDRYFCLSHSTPKYFPAGGGTQNCSRQ